MSIDEYGNGSLAFLGVYWCVGQLVWSILLQEVETPEESLKDRDAVRVAVRNISSLYESTPALKVRLSEPGLKRFIEGTRDRHS